MFSRLVRLAGLTKIELAKKLGLSKGTVYNWGENPPKYVLAYLEILTELNKYKS